MKQAVIDATEGRQMDKQDRIDQLNEHAPNFLRKLGGSVVDFDLVEQTCTMEFNISTEYCHSIDIVQGGFLTVMLDAAMTHAIFTAHSDVTTVSSLDVNTSYLEPTRAGKITAIGKIVKAHYKTVFLESQAYNDEGVLTATATSVAKVGRT